jgi:hypothetical protein
VEAALQQVYQPKMQMQLKARVMDGTVYVMVEQLQLQAQGWRRRMCQY